MAGKRKNQISLDDLIAKRDHHLAQYQRFDTLVRGLEGVLTEDLPAPAAKKDRKQAPSKSAPQIPSITSMPLPEAAAKQLSLSAGKQPQLPKQIWAGLKASGVVITSKSPNNAVLTALHRRARTHGDVALVGNGYWAMTEWYNALELAQLKKRVGGMGGRDREEHVRRTKEGIANLMAKGGRYGAVVKITPEVIERLRAHMAAGYTAKEASAMEKISAQSFYLLKGRGVTGLDRLYGEERRRALRKRGAAPDAAPDLLTPSSNDGSMH